MTSNAAAPADTRATLIAAATAELAEGGAGAVSLRAIARRAGLSHAAPAHFFGDRAGLLTAVATQGFERFAAHLEQAGHGAAHPVAALGRAYLEFAHEHPALLDLMFRGTDLHPDDVDLAAARRAAIDQLIAAVAGARADARDALPWALISWAFVHGLVVLGREGMLSRFADALGAPGASDADLAATLVDRYAAGIGE